MTLLDHFGVTIPMLRLLRVDMPEVMDLLIFCLGQFNEEQACEKAGFGNLDGVGNGECCSSSSISGL